MKKLLMFYLVLTLALTASVVASFAMVHDKMSAGMDNITHDEVFEGVKATVKVMSMKKLMQEMSLEMPKGVKETHHIMVEFKNTKTGKPVTEGEVTIKVQGPDKAEQVKKLMAMGGMAGMGAGFGADFNLSKKGTYGITANFVLKGGKAKNAQFRYEVK